MLNQRQCFILIQNPVLPLAAAVGHGAQNDLGDLQARVPEPTVCFVSMGACNAMVMVRWLAAGWVRDSLYRVYSI